MVLLLFHKCSCTTKDFFTEKCDLLKFCGTFVRFIFLVAPLFFNMKETLQSEMRLINTRKKNIYRTFDVVDKSDYMYYN